MEYDLEFNPDRYRVETAEAEGKRLVYRAYEDLVYVKRPSAPEYQKMNIYVPEAYWEGGSIGAYDKNTAPVFFANTVGGYMPGNRRNRETIIWEGQTRCSGHCCMVMWPYLWERGEEGLRVRTAALSAVRRPVLWI